LNNAYSEKITEKKFNEKEPKIIKIGNENIRNFKNMSILLLILNIII
tara:strand:+ start:851 stop:991 length:141 start_codon:yes stop_codon:yes gene_type:complete